MGSPIYEDMRALDCKFLIKPIKRNRLHHLIREIFPNEHKPSPPVAGTVASVFPTNLAARNPLSILTSEDNPIKLIFFSIVLPILFFSFSDEL